MALGIKLDFPSIGEPVGSFEEVQALHPDLPYYVASCSRPEYMKNKGCNQWDNCSHAWKGGRPEGVVCEINKPNGAFVVNCLHCRDALHMKEQIEMNRGFVKFVGGTGTKYKLRGTKRMHPRVDPSCPQCVIGNCTAHVDNVEEREVKALPPAAEHAELRRFAMRQEIAEERGRSQDATRERAYYGLINQPLMPAAPVDESKETPANQGGFERGEADADRG